MENFVLGMRWTENFDLSLKKILMNNHFKTVHNAILFIDTSNNTW